MKAAIDFALRVDPEHFDYLRLQKGSIDQWADQPAEWHRRYLADLQASYEQIAPWLPQACGELLDVGSGLGGIDILLARHYAARGQKTNVVLLDGYDDPPRMTLHRQTFNSMRIARNFHVKNGIHPLSFGCYKPDFDTFDAPFDLVLSLGSWCFHYPPSVYLPRLAASGLKPETVVVLDVRSHKPDWFGDLEKYLELVTMVHVKPKWSRCVFRVRPSK